MLLELNAHFPQMLRAYPNILEHFWIVMWYLATTHRSANVVMRDPYLVTHRSGSIVINLDCAAFVGLSDCEQPSACIF
ncbi:hypothetical protein D9M73_266350 [compost metagenome]